MAVDPSVRIDLAAEFTGRKAFNQADTATQKLTKNVKSLAKGFLGVFAAQKLIQYSKASVKAFAEDDAAAKSLGRTLENLGLAYGSNIGTVNGFINRLEAQTGVLDDELRPAMDRLLRATGDVTKSQELLSLALDIAAGTGKSVTQVSQSLQKAYLGQTAALGRLGVGLSKAELATGDFETIQAKLATLFAGQAATAANTYLGSLNKLQVAANNAKETIGKGLVDALGILSGSSTVDPTVSGIDRIANSIANAAKEAAKFISVSKTLFSDLSFFRKDSTTAAALRIKQGTGFTTPMSISSQDTQKADQAAKKAAEAKAKAAKAAADKQIKLDKLTAEAKIKADKLAAANKKKADAAAAALSKAAAVFDLNKIQIAAALKATYDKDTTLRLLAMQAIENDNGEAALNYIKQLNLLTAEQQTNKLIGIKGITETELSSINQLLLTELERIRLSKMSEEDKAAARQAAYTKYNAAIIESGGLADKNFYSEETQIELLKISRLASLDTVAAAQATYDTLNETTQAEIIARIAAAQKLADEAKMTALKDYLAEAGKPITQTITTQYVFQGPKGQVISTLPTLPDYSIPDYTDYIPANRGQTAFSPAQEITVIVEGNVLDGNDFTEKVNQALLNSQRTGLSQIAAGALP